MSSKEACCCTDETCWYGARISTGGNCEHTITERLEYRCPRKAWSGSCIRASIQNPPGDTTCGSCAGTDFLLCNNTCESSPDIVVRYSHYNPYDSGQTYIWHYTRSEDVYPECNNGCCGGRNDYSCCTGGSGCPGGWYGHDGQELSGHQIDAIRYGSVAPKTSNGSYEDLVPCQYGDSYKFLDGVSNSSGTTFNHYKWSDSAGGYVSAGTTNKLAETMVAVFHLQKWYQRSWNSMDVDDNPPAGGEEAVTACCRTPKHWVYNCAGIPVYSWEVVELSSLGNDQKKRFFELVSGAADPDINLRRPVPFTHAGDYEILNTLVSDGILQTPRDWFGSVGTADTPIKKTLKSSGGKTGEEYFYARLAGWQYVCSEPYSDCQSSTFDFFWPQVPFGYQAAGSCVPQSSAWPPQSTNCLTAAPLPGSLSSTCTCACGTNDGSSVSCVTNGQGNCYACLGVLTPGCVDGLSYDCGESDGLDVCYGDVSVGNCAGVRSKYFEYKTLIPSVSYINPYGCTVTNFTTLHRYEAANEPSDRMQTAESIFGVPYDTGLPDCDLLRHRIFVPVTEAIKFGESNPVDLCCGGDPSNEVTDPDVGNTIICMTLGTSSDACDEGCN